MHGVCQLMLAHDTSSWPQARAQAWSQPEEAREAAALQEDAEPRLVLRRSCCQLRPHRRVPWWEDLFQQPLGFCFLCEVKLGPDWGRGGSGLEKCEGAVVPGVAGRGTGWRSQESAAGSWVGEVGSVCSPQPPRRPLSLWCPGLWWCREPPPQTVLLSLSGEWTCLRTVWRDLRT